MAFGIIPFNRKDSNSIYDIHSKDGKKNEEKSGHFKFNAKEIINENNLIISTVIICINTAKNQAIQLIQGNNASCSVSLNL